MQPGEGRAAAAHWKSTAGCVLVFALCVLIARPFLEGGFSDDFSYIFTAKRAAETGRLIYNGWACPMLGIQVYLAALLIRIFGFSFTVTRVAVMLFAAANVALLHRLFLRLSPRNGNAVVAALSVCIAPVTFGHSVLFFTDVPGEFAFVAALFCCIRAMQSHSAEETRRWLLWCVLLNLPLGTVRQTAWLGSLLLLPAVGWRLRLRPGVLRLTAILWGVSAAFVLACVVWLAQAPYAPHENLLTPISRGWLRTLPILPLLALLELLPLLLSVFGIRQVMRNRRYVLVALAAALVVAAYTVTAGRVLPPLLIGLLVFKLPTFAFQLGMLLIALITFLVTLVVQEARANPPVSETYNGTRFLDLLAVLWPYLIVVSALVMTREGIWSRYVLPLVPALAVLLYSLHAERTHRAKLPAISLVTAALSATLAVALTHDNLLYQVPVLKLEAQYLRMGLPRAHLEAGMPEDGWYEISTGHHINEPRIRNPKNAYSPRPLTAEQRLCHSFFMMYAPDIHPVYTINDRLTGCTDLPPLAMETQNFWLRAPETQYLLRFVPTQRMP